MPQVFKAQLDLQELLVPMAPLDLLVLMVSQDQQVNADQQVSRAQLAMVE
jgi:hypothetical protein